MEFLESLYSNENFGLYLFIIIIVLIILFFVILFLGRKDAKKSKTNEPEPKPEASLGTITQEEPKKEDVVTTYAVPNISAAFKEITEEKPVEVMEPMASAEKPAEPVAKPKEESIFKPFEEAKKEEPTMPTVPNYNFESLANEISKELETIETKEEEKEEEKPVIEEQPFNFPKFESVVPDKLPEMPKEPEEVKSEPKPKAPPVFSSVYVNRNTTPTPPVEAEPEKPKIELPKKVELPKKADPQTKPTVNEVLNSLETESYHIDN